MDFHIQNQSPGLGWRLSQALDGERCVGRLKFSTCKILLGASEEDKHLAKLLMLLLGVRTRSNQIAPITGAKLQEKHPLRELQAESK